MTSWTKQNEKADLVALGCGSPAMPEMAGGLLEDIYRDHLKHRQIIINGAIDENTVELVTLQIMKINEEDDELELHKGYDRMANPISLKISSPGGYVDEGLGVISQIAHSQTPVIGVAIGNCASMAGLILMSCHARFSSIYSRVMIHSIAGGNFGKMNAMTEYVTDVMKAEQIILDEIVTSRTAITQAQLDKMHECKKDWWLSSAEAKAIGVIDDIVPMGIPMPCFKDRKKVKAKPAKKA